MTNPSRHPARPRTTGTSVPTDTTVVTAPVPSPSSALGLTNTLIALPWEGLSRQYSDNAERSILESLEGKDLIREGNGGGEFRWKISLTTRDIDASVNISTPPGLRRAALDGFELAAPLSGNWSVSISGALKGNASVWNPRTGIDIFSWSPSLPWGFRITELGLSAGVQLDPSPPDRPSVQGFFVHPQLSVGGSGAIPISVPLADFVIERTPHSITLTKTFTNLSLGLGDLSAKLTGVLKIAIGTRSNEATASGGRPDYDEEGTAPLEGHPALDMQVSLDGRLSFRLEQVGSVSCGLGFDLNFALPSIRPLQEVMGIMQQGLPRVWGETGEELGKTKPAPSDTDFDTPARLIENALASTHMPYDAVFSIQLWRKGVLSRAADMASLNDIAAVPSSGERTRAAALGIEVSGIGTGVPPIVGEPEQYYCLEEDSAIWTGHYLAAQSFRYAATASTEALARVRSALAGIQRLFDVTTDAVTRNGRRTAVQVRGIFARSALPTDSSILWWNADTAIRNGRCYYEKPEGGWDVVVGSTTTHFATYAQVEEYLRQIPRFPLPAVNLVGRVWRGVGCGDRCTKEADHPVSRDQYAGVFMGLFAAHQLVEDEQVRSTTANLITQALNYLLENKWNVPLPPNNYICTSYIGNFNHQMAFLRIGATVNPDAFGGVYQELSKAAELTWIPIWLSALDPMPDYYKFNLAHAVAWPTLFAETEESLREKYLIGYNMLRRATAHHRNAYFNLMRILVERPENRAVVAQGASGSDPHLSLESEIKGTLAEWLVRWQRVKADTNLPRNNIADPGYQLARWPQDVALYTALDLERSYRCKFAMPVDGRQGNRMDYVWQRHPFEIAIDPEFDRSATPTEDDILEYTGNLHPFREGPGVDYLLAYWSAVYLNVLPIPSS